MLAPHHGENSELGEIRLATQDFLDPLKLLRSQTVSFDQLRCDYWIGGRRCATHWPINLKNSPSLLNDANSKYFEYLVAIAVKLKADRSVRSSLESRT